jgi:hypothetical protein
MVPRRSVDGDVLAPRHGLMPGGDSNQLNLQDFRDFPRSSAGTLVAPSTDAQA